MNGLQFTKLHAIEFYKKLLQVVETDDKWDRGGNRLAGV